MRNLLAFLCLALTAACGGDGKSGGGDSGPGPAAWRAPVQDITRISPPRGSGALLPGAQPSGKVGMSGAFAARIGGTDEALYGAAHMMADFDAARVDGWVDQATLQRISLELPLTQAQPVKFEDLRGRLEFEGGIEKLPPVGEGMWFDAGYSGTLTGPQTELRVRGRTERGAFLSRDGKIEAFGNVTGSATRRRDGMARVMVLREGKIYVQQR